MEAASRGMGRGSEIAMSRKVSDGSNAGFQALEMPEVAVQSSGEAAYEAGRDLDMLRVEVRADLQASEELVANRGPLDRSRGWARMDPTRLEASEADRVSLGPGVGGIQVNGWPRPVEA